MPQDQKAKSYDAIVIGAGVIGAAISHPASSSHRGLSETERLALGISEGLIRVSLGIQDIELLKREFTAAVAAVAAAA